MKIDGINLKYKNLIGILMSAFISFIIIAVAFRIWEIDFNVPPMYEYDGMFDIIQFTSVYESGFVGNYFIDRMGAPFVAPFVDDPIVDISALIEQVIISKFTPSASACFYWFYFLSFPLSAITMFVLLKRLFSNIFINSVLSIIFSISPYHFLRGYMHFTLSNYYVIPVAILISLIIAEENFDGIFPNVIKEKKIKKYLYIGALILIGFSNIYYAFIGMLCMAVSLIFKIIRNKKISCLIHEGMSILISGISVLISLLPYLSYGIFNGKNEKAGARLLAECEYYSLKIIQLILPCEYNNIPFLKSINENYSANGYGINENSMSSLGLIASIGFVIACIWVIYSIASKNKTTNDTNEIIIENKMEQNYMRLSLFSLLILVLILYSVSGGFGTIFAYFITTVFRSINRTSIFISCLSLCVLSVSIKIFLENYSERKVKNIISVVIMILVAFVLFSEVLYKETGYQNNDKEHHIVLKDFFEKVENSLDEGDMVFNLPVVDFPEGEYMNYMSCYEPGYGYIYTKTIRWSYGAIKGRNDYIYDIFCDNGMSNNFVYNIKKNGFSGIVIDRYAYEDFGNSLISFYSDKMGLEPMYSSDERLVFINIKGIDVNEL